MTKRNSEVNWANRNCNGSGGGVKEKANLCYKEWGRNCEAMLVVHAIKCWPIRASSQAKLEVNIYQTSCGTVKDQTHSSGLTCWRCSFHPAKSIALSRSVGIHPSECTANKNSTTILHGEIKTKKFWEQTAISVAADPTLENCHHHISGGPRWQPIRLLGLQQMHPENHE